MNQAIDLDAAADVLEAKRVEWLQRGFDVGPITWAAGQTFSNPIVTSRAEVDVPYSLGIAVRSGKQEGEMILYSGAWADLEYWSGEVVGRD